MYLYPEGQTDRRTGGKLICPPTLSHGGIIKKNHLSPHLLHVHVDYQTTFSAILKIISGLTMKFCSVDSEELR